MLIFYIKFILLIVLVILTRKVWVNFVPVFFNGQGATGEQGDSGIQGIEGQPVSLCSTVIRQDLYTSIGRTTHTA